MLRPLVRVHRHRRPLAAARLVGAGVGIGLQAHPHADIGRLAVPRSRPMGVGGQAWGKPGVEQPFKYTVTRSWPGGSSLAFLGLSCWESPVFRPRGGVVYPEDRVGMRVRGGGPGTLMANVVPPGTGVRWMLNPHWPG